MVRQQQEMLFAGRLSASVFRSPPDLVRVAEGFGITAVDAGSAGWEKIAFWGSGPRFVRHAIGQVANPFVDLTSLPFSPRIENLSLQPGLLAVSGTADAEQLLAISQAAP